MPGVRMRFRPELNAALIVAAESVGCGNEELRHWDGQAGRRALAHVVPTELNCTEGTKTLSFPAESMYRYGASRVTGLVASVVYGPPHG